MYIDTFIIAVSAIFGFIAGCLCSIYILRFSERRRSKRDGREKPKKAKEKKANPKKTEDKAVTKPEKKVQEEPQENSQNEPQASLLKDRIVHRGSSWTAFNCDLDDENAESHIQRSREKQDLSYQYLKKVKEKISESDN